jgi:UPF0716 protein FxsA
VRLRLLLALIFIVVPIAELAVLIKVGGLIGLWPTLGLLVADAVLGSWLMRSQGRAAWARFTAALQAGRAPAREVTDGVLVVLGGAFLLAPGFITDLLGVVLLVPATRALVRRLVLRRAASRIAASLAGAPLRRTPRDYDVDGTAVDVDPPYLRGPHPGKPTGAS